MLYFIELVLEHGLKSKTRRFVFLSHTPDIAYFGKTVVWDFLKQLPNCLPGTDSFQVKVKRQDGDHAKARVWISEALNTRQIKDFIAALLWNEKVSR